MSLAKTALKRSFKFATLAGGIWKEEASRFLGFQEGGLARLKQAKLLVEELGKLKGVAMKLGQILALESRDYFPPEVVMILEKLQNQASFMDEFEVRQIIQKELAEKAALLQNLSPTPIAAASIGQVHRAIYGNDPVAVKIQYPGIQDTVDSDVKILKRIVALAAPLVGKANIDYSGLFNEVQSVFKKETSYLEEARLTARYQELSVHMPGIRVPKVFNEVSTDRVIVLGYENGETLSSCLQNKNLTREMRHKYADLFLKVFSTEFCEWGLVQTDPNLGNFLFDLENEELVLLDFGATREYTLDFRKNYSKLILASLAQDRKLALEIAITLELISANESTEAQDSLYKLLVRSLEPFKSVSFDFGVNDYVQEMRNLSVDLVKKLKSSPPPSELIFLHRKLGGIFQIIRRLNVSVDLRTYVDPYSELASGSRS